MPFMDPAYGHRLSRAELRKVMGLSPLYSFLEYFAKADVFYEAFDFRGDTIPGDDWAVANGGGTGVASYAVNVQRAGVIRATTGTSGNDTASASIISPAIYYGDALCGVSFRWKPVSAVTEARIEQGFVDVVPGSTKSVVNSLTTPTVNTSVVDAAVCVYNHTGSTTTNELVTIGSSISAAKFTYTPPTAIAAGTWNTVRLQIITNQAYLWMDGLLVAVPSGATDYIEGGSAIAIWARVAASNGSSKSHDIDLIQAWENRA
jgi:hypothetical protein